MRVYACLGVRAYVCVRCQTAACAWEAKLSLCDALPLLRLLLLLLPLPLLLLRLLLLLLPLCCLRLCYP